MSTDVADSDELIARASRGDLHAQERLWGMHRDRLRRMVASRLDPRVRARVDPSDVVQEALAEAATVLPRYARERPIPFVAWLGQIAGQRLAKLHRYHVQAKQRSVTREANHRPRLPEESVLVLAARLEANGTSPSQKMIGDERRLKVQHALARLSSADRELLLMRVVEQMAMAEIAELLGISEGAAKVRHLRALRRLGANLEPSP